MFPTGGVGQGRPEGEGRPQGGGEEKRLGMRGKRPAKCAAYPSRVCDRGGGGGRAARRTHNEQLQLTHWRHQCG